MKKTKTSNNRSRIFEIALEGERECLGELQSFNAFVMIKATFSKHWLVKLAWHVCIHKAWNLKYETREMTAATNEDSIGWLLENCCLMGKKWNFWLLGRIFPHPQGYSWRFRGRGNQSIPGGCNNFVTFLVRREMPGIWFWEIILLRDLAVIELFQISHNCVTECTLQAKFLLKLI